MRLCVEIPSTCATCQWHVSVLPELGGRERLPAGLWWPNSLGPTELSFSERMCLKNWSRQWQRKTSNVNFRPLHLSALCIPMCNTHTRARTHTHWDNDSIIWLTVFMAWRNRRESLKNITLHCVVACLSLLVVERLKLKMHMQEKQ